MTTNKQKAVAITYDETTAPRVIAKGDGFIAQQIIATAKEHGIPIENNEELTALLSQVKINQEIPPALYTAVAQLMIYLYYLDNNNKEECSE
jgi:flagellar biosynthesis protein